MANPSFKLDDKGNLVSSEEAALAKYGITVKGSSTPSYGGALGLSSSGMAIPASGSIIGGGAASMLPASPAPAPQPTPVTAGPPAPVKAATPVTYRPAVNTPAPATSTPVVKTAPPVQQATVFNPSTGQRKVVNVGDPNAFAGGFVLETKTDNPQTSGTFRGYDKPGSYNAALGITTPTTPTATDTAAAGGASGTPDITGVGSGGRVGGGGNSYADVLASGQKTITDSTAAGYVAPDTSALDKQLQDINSPQYKAEEYARLEKERADVITQEYAAKEAQLRQDAANRKAQRFSELASVGVNPLSSGAASVANEGDETLNKFLTNLNLEKNQKLNAMRAELLGFKNADIDKARKATEDARARLMEEAETKYQHGREGLQDIIAKTKNVIDLAKSGYDLSKSERDDAKKHISDLIDNYGSSYFEGMADADKRALEKSAGMKIGELDTQLAALKKKEEKAVKASGEAAKRKQDDDMIAKGWIPVGPAEVVGKPASEYQKLADGSYYLKPPAEAKTIGGEGVGYYEKQPNGTWKQIIAPKAKATGAGGGTGTSSADYASQLNQLKASIDTGPNSDGYYNTDTYKSIRSGLKTDAQKKQFDANFSHNLNPNDASAAVLRKGVPESSGLSWGQVGANGKTPEQNFADMGVDQALIESAKAIGIDPAELIK